MFERFTDDARRVVVDAQEESRRLGHSHIGTEHLLLGILHDDSPTGALLETVGVRLSAARGLIGQPHNSNTNDSPGHIPFTRGAKRMLEESLRQARRRGQDSIARPHLLRALLAFPDSRGARALVALGVDLDVLAARTDELAVSTESGTESRVSAGFVRLPPSVRRRVQHRPDPVQDDVRLEVVRLEELARQRDDLIQGLRRYGQHDPGCDPDRCSCGFQALLEDFELP